MKNSKRSLCVFLCIASSFACAGEPLDLDRTVYGPYIGVGLGVGLAAVDVTGSVEKTLTFAGIDCTNPLDVIPLCGLTQGVSHVMRTDSMLPISANASLGYEIIKHRFLFDAEGNGSYATTLRSDFSINPGDPVAIAIKQAETSNATPVFVVTGVDLNSSKKLTYNLGGKVRLGYMLSSTSAVFGVAGYSFTKYEYKFATPNETCTSDKIDPLNADIDCVPQADDARMLDIDHNLSKTIAGLSLGAGFKMFHDVNWSLVMEVLYTRFAAITELNNTDISLFDDGLGDTIDSHYVGPVEQKINMFQVNLGVNYSFHA